MKFPVGDYNSLGIPRMPPCRPKSPPARPQPPVRPPLPTTPKHTPKAGVISIVKPTGAEALPNQNVPHRAPPSIPAPYQQPEPRPSQIPPNPTQNSPPVEQLETNIGSLSIQDPDNNAIYEEIDDDVVSELHALSQFSNA